MVLCDAMESGTVPDSENSNPSPIPVPILDPARSGVQAEKSVAFSWFGCSECSVWVLGDAGGCVQST